MPDVRADVKIVLFFGDGADESGARFDPPDPEHFGVNVQVLIGELGDSRHDSFDLMVCSPRWFADAMKSGQRRLGAGPWKLPQSVVVGAHQWFMPRWDEGDFRIALNAVCEYAGPGPDWGTVANRIGRLIPWEFDYRYDDHVNAHYGDPFPPPTTSSHEG